MDRVVLDGLVPVDPGIGGNHQDPAVHADDIDVVAVQRAQAPLRPHDRFRGARSRRGHLPGTTIRSIAESSGFMSCADSSTVIRCSVASRRSSATISAVLADVEIGERLVQQQQPGAADQRVRDQDALAAARRTGRRPAGRRSRPHPRMPAWHRPPATACATGSGRPSRWPSSPSATRSRARSACTVEDDLLRHIAHGAPGPLILTLPPLGAWKPRMVRSSVVLPEPFAPIRPQNAPCSSVKLTSFSTLRPENETLTRSTASTSLPSLHYRGLCMCSVSVETLSSTALRSAVTSASIHDW